MNNTNMTGAELQALREACGLDRDQFGELCGVQGRSIKYWETGASNHGVPADVAAMVTNLEAKISKDAADEIDLRSKSKDCQVLMRGGDPITNEIMHRVYLALRRMGYDVRIVAFDVQAYKAWTESTRTRDTPANRQQWAKLAVKQQAKPHRADQPV